MPNFHIPAADFDLPRNLAILDTNVLVAYADKSDPLHDRAFEFLEGEDAYEWLVAPPVVIEACGFLAKRSKRRIALALLQWLLTPGTVRLFPPPHAPLQTYEVLWAHSEWMNRFEVDYVDAYLMEIAHRLNTECEFRPYIPIVTFDSGDFLKCLLKGYTFNIYDMQSGQLQEFG